MAYTLNKYRGKKLSGRGHSKHKSGSKGGVGRAGHRTHKIVGYEKIGKKKNRYITYRKIIDNWDKYVAEKKIAQVDGHYTILSHMFPKILDVPENGVSIYGSNHSKIKGVEPK